MTGITCKEAADRVVQQHGFDTLVPANFDGDIGVVEEYLADKVEEASFAYVEKLSDEERFSVWYTCDDSLGWQDGIYYYGPESSDKSEWLKGLSGYAIFRTIKQQVWQRAGLILV